MRGARGELRGTPPLTRSLGSPKRGSRESGFSANRARYFKLLAIGWGNCYNFGMLTAAFPKLEHTKFVQLVRKFYRSPWYCALIAVFMAVSELFSLELPVYFLYLAIGIFCLLLCEDTLGVVPIICCGYMTFSAKNNPGYNPETSVFRRPEALFLLGVVLVFAVVFLVGRLITASYSLPKKRAPRLVIGFAVLGAAYLLGGAFSGYYAANTVLYGFVQIVSLFFFYLFFYYTVDWRKCGKEYIAVVFFAIGVGMLAEIAGMYFLPGVIVDGELHREALFTGWGVYNNVGCIMAMCMPAPFYFAATKKYGWLYAVAGCVFFLGVVLTQSRGSILSAAAVLLACAVAAIIKAKKREKIGLGVVYGAFVLAVAIGLAVKRGDVGILFSSLFDKGMDSSGRLNIYKKCWETFRSRPFFGVGFYKTPGGLLADGGTLTYTEAPAGAFIPPRAHNTVLQLLASGGVVALIAYLYHRFETLWMYFRHPTAEKTFSFFCVVALLLTSLLDCNFFNIGPGILYGVLLVFAECTDPARKLYKEKRKQ